MRIFLIMLLLAASLGSSGCGSTGSKVAGALAMTDEEIYASRTGAKSWMGLTKSAIAKAKAEADILANAIAKARKKK